MLLHQALDRWGGPGVSHDSAGPPLRNAQPRADMVHGLASPGRAQTFPEATSLRIALSRAWSATSFFSRRVLLLECL